MRSRNASGDDEDAQEMPAAQGFLALSEIARRITSRD